MASVQLNLSSQLTSKKRKFEIRALTNKTFLYQYSAECKLLRLVSLRTVVPVLVERSRFSSQVTFCPTNSTPNQAVELVSGGLRR